MIYHFEDLNFRILSAGHVFHEQGSFSVKERPYAAFALRIAGHAKFLVGNTAFDSVPGDITFIPDGVPYEAEYTDGESIFVHFTECNYRNCENVKTGAMPYLRKTFEDMAEAFAHHDVYEVKSMLFHLLHLLAQNEKGMHDEGFAASMRYMKEHFADASLSLGAVARAGFMSEATLRRKCNRYLGTSPKEQLLKMRLAYGMTQLSSGSSVREAAHACGFSDEKFFARTVKRRYGAPPSAFREA